MINLNVKQWRSENQTKLDEFVAKVQDAKAEAFFDIPNSCACTCHRTDVEDEKMKAICMTCNCAFD